jgi:hypothetical protein
VPSVDAHGPAVSWQAKAVTLTVTSAPARTSPGEETTAKGATVAFCTVTSTVCSALPPRSSFTVKTIG